MRSRSVFLMPCRLSWHRPHPKGWDYNLFILLFPEPTLVPSIHTGMHAKSLQSCLTLCDLMDSSPPGSSVHGIPQGRILEWVATSFSSQAYRKS